MPVTSRIMQTFSGLGSEVKPSLSHCYGPSNLTHRTLVSRTPKPEYLIALATYWGVRWDSVPFNFWWIPKNSHPKIIMPIGSMGRLYIFRSMNGCFIWWHFLGKYTIVPWILWMVNWWHYKTWWIYKTPMTWYHYVYLYPYIYIYFGCGPLPVTVVNEGL